jgi:hypothetical protein
MMNRHLIRLVPLVCALITGIACTHRKFAYVANSGSNRSR